MVYIMSGTAYSHYVKWTFEKISIITVTYNVEKIRNHKWLYMYISIVVLKVLQYIIKSKSKSTNNLFLLCIWYSIFPLFLTSNLPLCIYTNNLLPSSRLSWKHPKKTNQCQTLDSSRPNIRVIFILAKAWTNNNCFNKSNFKFCFYVMS